jgi:hypothetical protein
MYMKIPGVLNRLARLEFPGTYYLAYRDIPEILSKHATGSPAEGKDKGT